VVTFGWNFDGPGIPVWVPRGHSLRQSGSYLRLIDVVITQLEARGTSKTCIESKKEREKEVTRST